jgi:peptidoglycan/xylan/chitin deacetylase (PgdA/CDA1 family)/tetratricopeptide (TPR) repeat protein
MKTAAHSLAVCSVAVLLAIAASGCRRPSSEVAGSRAAPAAIPAAPPAPQATQPLPADIAAIVDAYRKIIVLADAEATLEPDDRQRSSIAGRILYQQNHQRLTLLGDRLTTELSGRGAPNETIAFLTTLEGLQELRDVDKLAFADLVADLLDTVGAADAASPAKALQPRLEADQKALKEIQSLYDNELEKVFGRFETRGMTVRREAWDSYVAFLKTRYRAADILKEFATATESIQGTRSGSRSGESALEMSGTRLPVKTLVLTFDDGPHPKYTDRIREILQKYQVPAVFFEVGQNLGTMGPNNHLRATRAAAASQRLLHAGFSLANHTFSHELLSPLSDAEIAGQIEQADRVLKTVSNPTSILFRPPYGARNDRVLAAVQARGMKSILWNIDSRDWADPIPKSIANRVIQLAEGERRGIILFHDIQARTIEALPAVIETLQARGYRFVGWNGTEFADDRSTRTQVPLTVSAPVPLAPSRSPYRESWAVIVGIDNYARWPRLSYAGNDARAIRELLVRKYSFKPENITMLLNEQATREHILSALGDTLADPAKVSKEDRVFFFFAGHGATRQLPSGRALGYIVPVEADLTNYQSQAISMTNFQDISEAIPAKHVFFMSDACYSGLAATRGGGQNYLQEVTRRTARQVLTAGGADEEVADNGPNGHSIFTWTVLQGLEGRADLNNDSYITASELASYVGPIVSSLSRQTPAFATLAGSEGGEFIFELKHETEFLNDESAQLDEEGIKLNGQIEGLRAAIAEKRKKNERLRAEVESAKAQLQGTVVPPQPSAKPPTAVEYNDRGMVLFREKQYAEALKSFLEAARLNPTNALAANNVGYTYFKMNQHDQSVQWFQKTIAIDQRRAIAYANLGDAYLALGRRPDARSAYEKYLELQPTAKYASTVKQKLQAVQ